MPTDMGKSAAIAESDKNLAALRSEFGDNVLPMFHKGEGAARLQEGADQDKGYVCLSPNNDLAKDKRWRWAQLARMALGDLGCDVQTHGLATTGNDMIREARPIRHRVRGMGLSGKRGSPTVRGFVQHM